MLEMNFINSILMMFAILDFWCKCATALIFNWLVFKLGVQFIFYIMICNSGFVNAKYV